MTLRHGMRFSGDLLRVHSVLGDGLERGGPEDFWERNRTNAQILKEMYRLIQDSVSEGTLVLGCNTVGHLVAGIHQIQRVGDDTSGRSFEWTRRHGIHSMMRAPPEWNLLYGRF